MIQRSCYGCSPLGRGTVDHAASCNHSLAYQVAVEKLRSSQSRQRLTQDVDGRFCVSRGARFAAAPPAAMAPCVLSFLLKSPIVVGFDVGGVSQSAADDKDIRPAHFLVDRVDMVVGRRGHLAVKSHSGLLWRRGLPSSRGRSGLAILVHRPRLPRTLKVKVVVLGIVAAGRC